MKEKYEKPSVKLNEFEAQDVLTNSGEENTKPWGGEEVSFG